MGLEGRLGLVGWSSLLKMLEPKDPICKHRLRCSRERDTPNLFQGRYLTITLPALLIPSRVHATQCSRARIPGERPRGRSAVVQCERGHTSGRVQIPVELVPTQDNAGCVRMFQDASGFGRKNIQAGREILRKSLRKNYFTQKYEY